MADALVTPLKYTEYPVAPDLVPWIACFWEIQGRIAAGTRILHRVLPDGCTDLLFDLEGIRRSGGTAALLVGPMSRAGTFGLRGLTDMSGIRLRPGAIGRFGIAANRLLDNIAPLCELRVPLPINIAELAEQSSCAARIRILTAACRAMVARIDLPDLLIQEALVRWRAADRVEFPRISVVTRDLGISERAFERRFAAQVGQTPVHYRRLARFRSVLRLYASGIQDWAALAATTGFSDQSHLVRDCREFAGLTPTEWAATQGAAGFLQDGNITTT